MELGKFMRFADLVSVSGPFQLGGLSIACFPISVRNFDDIRSTEFSFNLGWRKFL
jgi:hypothetical protein